MPFVAALPSRKSDKANCGCRTARFDTRFDGKCHGTLTVETPGKPAAVYAVARFDCDLAGQAYRCEKVAGGTDREADSYDVFLGERGEFDSCECRGFLRYGYCVHLDSLKAVIDLGALHLPDFDVGQTEPDDWADGEFATQYEFADATPEDPAWDRLAGIGGEVLA